MPGLLRRSGKTTAAERYLTWPNSEVIAFVNTDEIARGLSPFAPEKARVAAGKIFFERFAEFLDRKESFAIETTLSGVTLIQHLLSAKHAGYRIKMIYLFSGKPSINIMRVKQRVLQGGHDVPAEDIRRRHERSLGNLVNVYWDICDIIEVYDTDYFNALCVTKDGDSVTYSQDDPCWQTLQRYKNEKQRSKT